MTFYQKTKQRQLKLAREYRERNRESINAKQRARYQDDSTGYREYQLKYQAEYRTIYFTNPKEG